MSAVVFGQMWSWRLHDGRPAQRDANYLVPPDPAIGPVITAQTNCTYGGGCALDGMARRELYKSAAGALVLLAVAVAAQLGVHVIVAHLPFGVWSVAVLGAGGLSLLAFALATWLFRARRSSYVGALGLQSYLGRPGLSARQRVVRFADCARLRVERIRQHLNGSYVGTRYRYEWVDARNTCMFVIAGRYDDRRPLAATEPVLFAHAAERAWQAWRRRQ